ncbi:FAD-binding domain-containing protein [Vararia minispora EC-137]|uniref:FAD-binding domain-containing protein n=1 Tax=Vararia minispora EC-137 TaxID=1314806 RepID=A0ACB8QN35_9AGAM|nr:FAD-binding domain-containing protein [Vararia minispora EC-137]
MFSRAFPLILSAGVAHASLRARNVSDVCSQIANQISGASGVFYPSSAHYEQDIGHWLTSSLQQSTCSVEPGTAEDVSTILQVLASTRTPFGVKGGGHSTNIGFSSTLGVQISMNRFNEITLSGDKTTVDVGAGLIWDDIYAVLNGSGVNVVGGRIPGVGVAGFTLGGVGYTWKTSQYGLTLDNVAAYKLVLPNGTITTVTAADEDLWFGLRVRSLIFGIVTTFTLVTHPQTDVWGGPVTVSPDQFDALNAAIANFSANNTDTKAAILPTYSYSGAQPGLSVTLFYDAPTPPNGLFDDLLAVPAVASHVATRSFADLVTSGGFTLPTTRGALNSVSVLHYTPLIIQLITNLTAEWGQRLGELDDLSFVSVSIEPFNSALFSHGAPSAYPPDRSRGIFPTNVFFSWQNATSDDVFVSAMKNLTGHVRRTAVAEGQDVEHAAVYDNYALGDTPLEDIYGHNVARLHWIRTAIDPDDVMGLAGGFKF